MPDPWERRLRRTLGAGDPPADPASSRYERLEELGRGGMAVVHRAIDRRLNRPVAIKVLRDDRAPVPEARERFLREAQAAAKLSHPGLVAVHDVFEEGDAVHLVMELVEGPSLARILEQRNRSLKELAAIVRDAALAAHHAHENGIVHRDLKPSNILVGTDGRPRIVDFGLAHLAEAELRLTRSGASLGSPGYMAPEQVRGAPGEIDARTDVFALGAILYQALAGRSPFPGATLAESFEGTLHRDPDPPGGPPELAAIALKALEKERSRRYRSAAEFAEDLRRWLDGEPVSARRPGPLSKIGRAIGRHPLPWAGALLAILVAASMVRLDAGSVAQRRALSEGMAHWERFTRLVDAEGGVSEPADKQARMALERFESAGSGPEGPWMTGRCRLLLGEEAAAESAWWEALRREPGFGPARFELAKLYLGRFAGARLPAGIPVSSGRIAAEPPGPESPEAADWRGKTEALGRRGLTTAENAYLDGLLAFGRGEYGPSAASIQTYVAENPWDGRAALLLGVALLADGRPAAAERPLARAVRLDRGAAPRRMRGDALLCLGRPAEALTDYDAALAADPARAESHAHRGLALKLLGRLPEAETSASAALERRPRWARGLNIRGTIRAERRDLAGAQSDFEEAILHHPAYAEAYGNLGSLFLLRGEIDRAIEEYDTGLAIAGDDADLLANRGRAMALRGDAAGAAADLLRASSLQPARTDLRLTLARALIAAGRREEAGKELAVVEKDGSEAERAEAKRLAAER